MYLLKFEENDLSGAHVTRKGTETINYLIYHFNVVFSFVFIQKISNNCNKLILGFSLRFLIHGIYEDKFLKELFYLWAVKCSYSTFSLYIIDMQCKKIKKKFILSNLFLFVAWAIGIIPYLFLMCKRTHF